MIIIPSSSFIQNQKHFSSLFIFRRLVAISRQMAWNQSCCFSALLFFFIIFFFEFAAAASSSISNSIFEDQRSMGRSLLQTKKGCPINFETMNYTIITSQCKGPLYQPKFCCAALKQFACPISDQVNDMTNECATTMFSYINLYGKYPPGLFANSCKESKEGLDCNALPPASANDKSTSQITRLLSPFFVTVCFIVLLAQIF